jgi:metallo-beta-lactamase class B
LKTKTICLMLILVSICQGLGADDSTTVELRRISQRVWVHTSFEMINGSRTDSNGLIIDCSSGLVLVDTCWNDLETLRLIEKSAEQFQKPILLAIITHAHADRIGGIKAVLKKGVKVVSTALTSQMATEAGYPAPKPALDQNQTDLLIGDVEIETYYPGPGHTNDNIVVWVRRDSVLFGGCLIKSLQSRDLGNIVDAEWASSVRMLELKYPTATIVVPGNGPMGNIGLLEHTIDLCPK